MKFTCFGVFNGCFLTTLQSSPIMEFPTTAGIDLFYGIHPIANSAFDPETMDFAPMKCDFVEYNESGDPSQSYTMFDLTVDPTSCENTPIKLHCDQKFCSGSEIWSFLDIFRIIINNFRPKIKNFKIAWPARFIWKFQKLRFLAENYSEIYQK